MNTIIWGSLLLLMLTATILYFTYVKTEPKYKVGDILICNDNYETWEEPVKAVILEVGKNKYRYKFWNDYAFGEDQSKEFDIMHRLYIKL